MSVCMLAQSVARNFTRLTPARLVLIHSRVPLEDAIGCKRFSNPTVAKVGVKPCNLRLRVTHHHLTSGGRAARHSSKTFMTLATLNSKKGLLSEDIFRTKSQTKMIRYIRFSRPTGLALPKQEKQN